MGLSRSSGFHTILLLLPKQEKRLHGSFSLSAHSVSEAQGQCVLAKENVLGENVILLARMWYSSRQSGRKTVKWQRCGY